MLMYAVVKEHVDRLDRMGFLAMGAPKDEYDLESRMITERIDNAMSAEVIAQIMADVFSQTFSQEESPAAYMDAARRICEDLHP